ncbi:LysR family transcriptional regulator [Labrenzia sp. PHM005]|uniref:LysR family transcriptional regulator n=1 Tax=Labrenzia sp. PHM005 TaxID=2590016 RepID=UPI0011405D73|nr:LysR substrate-binding domain-containing protein [Labrenzia sp. PHM005]QDG76232.1 LysR family transcriptional regulator [Labrenzia sp. PHM005]
MNLSQMTAFRAVMNSASLSEAAEKLGRTQPAVSAAIRSLEETLGLKLFERRGRQLVPVPEAQYLMAEASEILDRVSSVAGTMKSLKAGQSGSLNVACMPGPSTFLMPRYISQAVGANPDVHIVFSSRSSPQIRELGATQGLDFGFADLIGREPSTVTFRQETISANCFCALPIDHPLADKDTISWKDLDHVPLGLLQSSHIVRQKTVQTMLAAGVTPNVVLDSQFFLPIMQFISVGRCLSIVDPLTMVTEQEINSAAGRVVFRKLSEAFRYDYSIITPIYRPLSQLARRIKEGWQQEVMGLLTRIEADPVYCP